MWELKVPVMVIAHHDTEWTRPACPGSFLLLDCFCFFKSQNLAEIQKYRTVQLLCSLRQKEMRLCIKYNHFSFDNEAVVRYQI